MKRVGTLLVLLLTYGGLAAGAEARKVEARRVIQSPDDVAAYWTAARMRDARPAEPRRVASTKGRKAAAGGATELSEPYNVFPTATNGKVFFTGNGVNYACSGTALAGLSSSVVWTAGHCVNEGPGAYYTNWAFVPAYRDGARPYGTWVASTLYTTSQWSTHGDFSYDLGAARVAPNSGTNLTASIGGGRTPAFNQPRTEQYNSFGYPATAPYNGQRLWKCDSSLYTNDTSTSPQTMGIQCSMTRGSSGGGWVAPADGKVYSVNSYGRSNLRDVMFGPYQGDVAQQLFTTADAP
jgi:hypothetical protein